ncbi:Asp23/Gls24 family envelope stress response protein [Actinokineospora soli]|uniref:Asp23/Gls24 family envelope stress response protein n=1 Tax=Actinokineospora soli TaxID=1048753 RepID=A0ABW2TLJ8_9PSEU
MSADAGDRGALTIAPSVVRAVAERAADTTPGAARVARALGLGARGASASVDGDGPRVDVRIELALSYPAAVRAVATAVRARVTEDVERITGYRVRGVDVVVTGLVPPERNRVE